MSAHNTPRGGSEVDFEIVRQAEELLNKHIEPLVDSLAQLILCASTCDLSNVESTCQNIQLHTTSVVEAAANFAVKLKNKEMQKELTLAINKACTVLEALLPSFIGHLQCGGKDTKIAREYAENAHNFGNAVNEILVISDLTGFQRCITLINEAIKASRRIHKSIGERRGNVSDGLQDLEGLNAELQAATQKASSSCSKSSKRNAIDARSDDVNTQTFKYITLANKCAQRGGSEELDGASETLIRRLENLLKV